MPGSRAICADKGSMEILIFLTREDYFFLFSSSLAIPRQTDFCHCSSVEGVRSASEHKDVAN